KDRQGDVIEANQIVPLHALETAGDILMKRKEVDSVRPERFLATVAEHPKGAVAFIHRGQAMAPRFGEGDTVTISPQVMAEPGSLVWACWPGQFVFRRFLPAVEGSVIGARLVPLNPAYPDRIMEKDDVILGRMLEHISHSHV